MRWAKAAFREAVRNGRASEMTTMDMSNTPNAEDCRNDNRRDLLHMVDVAISLAKNENKQFVVYLLSMARQEIVDRSN